MDWLGRITAIPHHAEPSSLNRGLPHDDAAPTKASNNISAAGPSLGDLSKIVHVLMRAHNWHCLQGGFSRWLALNNSAIKQPRPDHPPTIEPSGTRVVCRSRVKLSSTRAER